MMTTNRLAARLTLLLVVIVSVSLFDWQHLPFLPNGLSTFSTPEHSIAQAIFWEFRLPRTIAAVLIGCSLAIAGVIMQSVLRNDLCEPGIMGASSGVNFAITVAILFGLHQSTTLLLLPALGIIGGLLTVMVVCLLALRKGATTSTSLVLIGIATTSAVGASTLALSLSMDRNAYAHAVAWMSGSLGRADWSFVLILLLTSITAFTICYVSSTTLDVIRLHDELSTGLGLSVTSSRLGWLILASLIGSAAISTVGNIPFVGIVAPHLGRRLVGDVHQRVLLVSPVIGALLVTAADAAGRTLFRPYEIPAGIVVAIVGGCYFLWLLCSPTIRAK